MNSHREPAAEPARGDARAAKVLQSFFRDGRLVQIPARHSKRRIVLDFLAQEFEPGVQYTEAEVNERLERWHADFCALRRCLVDEEFLDRAGGKYWRCGGRLDVDGTGSPWAMPPD